MASKDIRFFLPEENQLIAKEKVEAKALPKGYISNAGKIIFPSATIEELIFLTYRPPVMAFPDT